MIGFWAKYSINFCPYRSLGKNVRELTHQSIRSHHPCIGKAVPIIFEVESIHSISKEIFFFVQFIRRTLRTGNPLLQWKFLEISLEEDKNICRNSSPEGAIAASKTLLLNLAPSWGWYSKHTCKHCQIYIIFLLVIEFVNFDFDFEDGSERNKSYWIGW